MKSSIYLLILIIINISGVCQNLPNSLLNSPSSLTKQTINEVAFNNWPDISQSSITNDGNYFGYITSYSSNNERTLMVISTQENWKYEATISGSYTFTTDNAHVIWINKHDSLCVLNLGDTKIKYIPNVLFYNIYDQYLLYKSNNNESGLVELNIKTGKLWEYSTINNFSIIENKKSPILHLKSDKNEQIVTITRKKRRAIKVLWSGKNAANIVKDDMRNQLIFTSGKSCDTFWYYKKNMKKAIPLSLNTDSSVLITGISHFSKDGEFIFVHLSEKRRNSEFVPYKHLVIWNYLDNKLQSQQSFDESSKLYKGIIRIKDKKIIRLDYGNDWIYFPKLSDTVILTRHQKEAIPGDEINWHGSSSFSWSYQSLHINQSKNLDDIGKNTLVELSPRGKYIIYYDRTLKNYFAYETSSGFKRNITINIKENWGNGTNNNSFGRYIGGWESNDASVFIYGEYDIWQIDPTLTQKPINLTNNMGKIHSIVFSFALEEYSKRSINKHESLILTAFNLKSKDNGFYKKRIGRNGDPDSLTMGPYIYDITYNSSIPNGLNYSPIKAERSMKYIVRRMSAKEAPNFYLTNDFKSFKALSHIHPEEKYIWYRTELHQWESLNRSTLQGILFKPENFNPLIKYPVILYCYEKKSDALNTYLRPAALDNGCAINIPYYVSNGYLIFCPDISYEIGDPMTSCYNAIISAAIHLKSLPYVDSKRMGIQGCSWGGIQVNYIITHSNIFAAACSASGIINWVSAYGSLRGDGGSMQGMFEIGQFRMGTNLWQNNNAYLKNSGILNIDKISTPILLMHTKDDQICPYSNIQEFYTGLRRLGKKGWLLTYEGNHALFNEDEKDFSLRMRQFFDHYLKSNSAPIWMTRQIPPTLQRTKYGLLLDKEIKTPGDGLILKP